MNQGLGGLVQENTKAKYLSFSKDLKALKVQKLFL